ncbi:transglutaminase domain-containing protein [Kordia jejudonensis]|uniref:transglutaminase domain-containing protein n=1 Tax=Kordia jejudonensis TaxID=1348245 RepID=UPI000699E5A5|nr:transglutaminase domain-containing protein [Kordia jejudonensis]
MKLNRIFFVVFLALCACTNPKESTYNGSPVIKATSDWTAYKIDTDWYRGQWSIAPQVAHDTLQVVCHKNKESFEFITDMDTIAFDVSANTTKDFYVQLNDSTYAHTIIQGVPLESNQLNFDTLRNSEIQIKYQTEKSAFLEELKQTYALDFIDKKMTDTEIVLAVLNWTNSRWKHNGNNSPSKNDAITILNEAKAGKQFPCFAFAIVLKDQLNTLGFNARTVYLKTQDAADRKGPPGHVATEVFINDLQKWVFIDGQFNVMPTLNNIPLNAVEFQDAINNDYDNFTLESLAAEKSTKRNYVNFVYDYLYYFDTSLDHRYEKDQRHTIAEKQSIMLVPLGAKNLTHIDFWNMNVDYCVYTNSINDFYAKPN